MDCTQDPGSTARRKLPIGQPKGEAFMAGTPRIYVDPLNTGGRANQVVLDTAGTLSDLERHGIVLREDLVLHLYSDDADESGQRDDLTVEGVVHFDEQNGRWLAIYDPAAFIHESDLRDEE